MTVKIRRRRQQQQQQHQQHQQQRPRKLGRGNYCSIYVLYKQHNRSVLFPRHVCDLNRSAELSAQLLQVACARAEDSRCTTSEQVHIANIAIYSYLSYCNTNTCIARLVRYRYCNTGRSTLYNIEYVCTTGSTILVGNTMVRTMVRVCMYVCMYVCTMVCTLYVCMYCMCMCTTRVRISDKPKNSTVWRTVCTTCVRTCTTGTRVLARAIAIPDR